MRRPWVRWRKGPRVGWPWLCCRPWEKRGWWVRKLQEALDVHRLVSDQAAAHLNLLSDNTYMTPWLAAKLLSKDKDLAQNSAALLVKHLATTRPANRTSFEKHLFTQEELWKNLEDFSKANPPVLLWQWHGKYLHLLKFLAPLFLLAPDHVLDAERIHARWQWLCSLKCQ